MSSPALRTDVVIIGAGPVGLFAVVECGMLKMKCHVVDSLDVAGGQCPALYTETLIYDIPGDSQIAALWLTQKSREPATPFSPFYLFGPPGESAQVTQCGG